MEQAKDPVISIGRNCFSYTACLSRFYKILSVTVNREEG